MASNQSASESGESPRWPLNSSRSGSRDTIDSTASSQAASSGNTLSLSQVKRLSTAARAGSDLVTVVDEHVFDVALHLPRDRARGRDVRRSAGSAPTPDR